MSEWVELPVSPYSNRPGRVVGTVWMTKDGQLLATTGVGPDDKYQMIELPPQPQEEKK